MQTTIMRTSVRSSDVHQKMTITTFVAPYRSQLQMGENEPLDEKESLCSAAGNRKSDIDNCGDTGKKSLLPDSCSTMVLNCLSVRGAQAKPRICDTSWQTASYDCAVCRSQA